MLKTNLLIEDLKSEIARIEGVSSRFTPDAQDISDGLLHFHVKPLDDAFNQHGLPLYALHEITSIGCDHGAASGFLSALLSQITHQKSGSIFWLKTTTSITEKGALYGPGLKAFNLNSSRILFAETSRLKEALWALEEAASLDNLSAIVADLHLTDKTLSLKESRRLHLRAEANKTPILLNLSGQASASLQSASLTRWHVQSSPSPPFENFTDGLGLPSFQVKLLKNRAGKEITINLMWDQHHGCFQELKRQAGKAYTKPPNSGVLVALSPDRPVDAA